MNAINDGGPAHPVTGFMADASGVLCGRTVDHTGMSFRDYFAANTVAGLCANPGGPFQRSDMHGWGLCNCDYMHIAQTAYALADAMLQAREQSKAEAGR